MALPLIVTAAGRAALVNAANTGTAPVTIAQVGISAAAVTPTASATALPGEIKRIATLSGDVVADDTIHLIVRDESEHVYTLRSFALYLADGTLFAIYGQPDVILEKSSQALMLLAIDVQFADVAAAELTFGDTNFLNPPATTERQGVVELATVAEAQAGIDALRALTPATAKAAILGWLLAQDGAGCGLDADLLDGQHGSFYTDIIARLGFNPVDKAGDTMTGLLTLLGAPTSNLHAATKQYVDGLVTASALLTKMLTVDGSGSGTDSDLLDGQHGSFYADIAARLGFTPANKAGDTMTGPLVLSGAPTLNLHAAPKQYIDGLVTASALLTKLLTVDGSGSGIDSDLLDGQQGSYYTAIATRLGYTPANAAGQLFTGPIRREANFGMDMADANSPIITLSATANIRHSRVLNEVWITLNNNILYSFTPTTMYAHGAPVLTDVARSLSQNGYQRLSNGLVLQWGTVAGSFAANTNVWVSFPIAFPTELFIVTGANSDVAAQAAAVVGFNYSPPPGATGFYFRTSSGGSNRLNWIAIGK